MRPASTFSNIQLSNSRVFSKVLKIGKIVENKHCERGSGTFWALLVIVIKYIKLKIGVKADLSYEKGIITI